MKVATFIANRIAFNQQRSFSRFIIRLSTVATIISVAVMIIALAFANGFQSEVSKKVFSFMGHIRIMERQPMKALIAEETPLIENDTLVADIRKNPAVQQIHPYATKYGILKTKDEIEGVLVKGYDSTYQFDFFKRFIREGRPLRFVPGTYSREIMISEYTAKQLGLRLNDRIMIYFIRPDGQPRPDKLTIAGIYKTGIEEYDKTFAIGDLRLIQRLNDWDPMQAGGYEVFLRDYKQADQVAEAIFDMDKFPLSWEAVNVRDVSPNIFDWLNMQDVTRNVLIGIMIFVALINLVSCLIILVLERVRMIGVLKALGANNWTIQNIFLRHAIIITLTGIIVGTLLALGLLWLQKKTGFIKLQEEAYYIREAAVQISALEIFTIAGCTLLISALVLMIPTLLIRKIQPVQAIRFQ
ncbi:MAG: ABC transporter permease [Chitinophagaceae bacterium]|nr:ABC transporter permease [Chitinophagaceae bacterium]